MSVVRYILLPAGSGKFTWTVVGTVSAYEAVRKPGLLEPAEPSAEQRTSYLEYAVGQSVVDQTFTLNSKALTAVAGETSTNVVVYIYMKAAAAAGAVTLLLKVGGTVRAELKVETTTEGWQKLEWSPSATVVKEVTLEVAGTTEAPGSRIYAVYFEVWRKAAAQPANAMLAGLTSLGSVTKRTTGRFLAATQSFSTQMSRIKRAAASKAYFVASLSSSVHASTRTKHLLSASLTPKLVLVNYFSNLLLLDSFKRAEEKVLSNKGKWTKLHLAVTAGQVVSERYSASTPSGSGEDGAYWNPAEYAEPFVSVGIIQQWLSGGPRLYACLKEPGTGEESGYRVRLENVVGSESTLYLERIDKGVVTVLAEALFPITYLATSDRLGLLVASGKVTAWRQAEGKGEPIPLLEASDSTYTVGFIGIGCKSKEPLGNGGSLINFEVEAVYVHGLKRATVHALQAAASFKGTLERRAARAASAGLSFAATLPRRTVHGLSAALSPSGTLRRTYEQFRASLSPEGALLRATVHGLSGKVTFLGTLPRTAGHALTASLSFLGVLPRRVVHEHSASVSSAGTLQRSISHRIPAGLSFLVSLASTAARSLTATLTPSGVLPRNPTHRLPATLTPSFLRVTGKVTHQLRASITPEGTLTIRTAALLSATLSFAAALPRHTAHRLSSSLSFLVSLVPRLLAIIVRLTASLSPSAALQRNTVHPLQAMVSFSTSLMEDTVYPLFASLSFAATLTKRFGFVKRLEASLSFTGTLRRSAIRRLEAVLSAAGSLSSATRHGLVASASFAGSLPRRTIRPVVAVLTLSGTLHVSSFVKQLGAVLSPTVVLQRGTGHGFVAMLKAAGALQRTTTKRLAARLGLAGVLTKAVERLSEFASVVVRPRASASTSQPTPPEATTGQPSTIVTIEANEHESASSGTQAPSADVSAPGKPSASIKQRARTHVTDE